MAAHHSCDSFREGNLNVNFVSPSTCTSVRKKLRLVADVDQLGGYAHLARGQEDAPFKNIIDIQARPDLGNSEARLLKRHHRSACDDTEPCGVEARQLRDNFVG